MALMTLGGHLKSMGLFRQKCWKSFCGKTNASPQIQCIQAVLYINLIWLDAYATDSNPKVIYHACQLKLDVTIPHGGDTMSAKQKAQS